MATPTPAPSTRTPTARHSSNNGSSIRPATPGPEEMPTAHTPIRKDPTPPPNWSGFSPSTPEAYPCTDCPGTGDDGWPTGAPASTGGGGWRRLHGAAAIREASAGQSHSRSIRPGEWPKAAEDRSSSLTKEGSTFLVCKTCRIADVKGDKGAEVFLASR